jgi:transcription initiation factor TFIIIB Brf1 subunit/transcription initiation factor TFIIB
MCECQSPDPVLDYAGGAEVCRGCGVVLDGVVFADGREWWGDDAARAGPAPDQFQPAPTTRIDNPRGVSKRVLAAAAADGAAAGERLLREGFRVVDAFARNMLIATNHTVVVRAKELFRDLHAVKPVRGDAREPAAAAALYYGFKMESAPRELKDLAGRCGVATRGLHAAVDAYKEHLPAAAYHGQLFATVAAGNLINAYGDRLPVSDADRKAVKRAAHRLDERLRGRLDSGRRPATVVSGLLFVGLREAGVAVPKKALLAACGVCQQTLDRMAAEIAELLDDM